MADRDEVFRHLEDSSGEGIAHVGKAPGAAQSTDNQAPVLPAVDGSGNLQNMDVRDAGDSAASTSAQPSLVATDSSDNLQWLEVRNSGQASAGIAGQPGLIAVDSSGDFAWLNVTDAGELITKEVEIGTVKQTLGASNTGVVDSRVQIASIALLNSKTYVFSIASVAATKACKWQLSHIDDATENILETKITGPGDYNAKFELSIEFTTGATGSQALRIYGTQLRGPATDLYASLKCVEKA